MCRLLSVFVSGYYNWKKRPASHREKEDNRLVSLIEKIHKGSRFSYENPRINQHLKALRKGCSRKRLEKLMRDFGI